MHEVTFKLTKDNNLEYPARFKGREVKYNLPDTLAEFQESRVAPAPDGTDAEAHASSVTIGAINGQGLSLTIQKAIKDFLNSPKVKGAAATDTTPAIEAMDTDAAIAAATDFAAQYRLGAPRAKGEGTKGKQAVAAAEAKASAATAGALDLYRLTPKNLRGKARELLVAQGVATVEQLDAIDAEK